MNPLVYNVECLMEGYAFTSDQGHLKACGSVTLIKGTKHILVDTGGPADAAIITSGLEKRGLKCSDIDCVIGTHGHSDHIGNLNLFPEATFVVSHDISKGNVYIDHVFDSNNATDSAYTIDESVSVISTPGHTCSDVSVVVKNTKYGTVVVAGDIFERREDLEDDTIWKANSYDAEKQMKSRTVIFNIADYIVPGHGPMFKVPAT